MANLFNLLQNFMNKENISPDVGVSPLQELPQFKTMQMNADGSTYEIPTPTSDRRATIGQKLNYALLGTPIKEVVATDDSGNPIYSTENVRKGGILRDIASGYRENRNQNFSLDNWGQNNGNLAKRLGEGFGSLVKFAESPAGRALLTGAAVGMTGGNGLQALTYGTVAGAKNQANRMADKMYRDDLERQEIDTSNIAGYINDDVYTNMLRSKQLQDNAEWRKTYYENQKQQNELNQQLAREKFAYEKTQDAIANALKSRSLDIQASKTQKAPQLSAKDLSTYRDNLATLKDIDAGLELIEKNPNAYSLVKGALPAWATNRIDPKGIATRTQIDNITAVYRKWLTGAQMSDAERKAYERFLPAPTDNYETIRAKLQGMRDSIERKNSIFMEDANMYQNAIDNTQNEGWAF